MSYIKNEDIRSLFYKISKSLILPRFRNLKQDDIKLKNKTDLVTIVDLEVENELKKNLLKILPNSLFVGEESFFENPKIFDSYYKNQYCWTVDPIDGTRNFTKGNENFAIMAALTFKEKIIQSWIYNPCKDEFCHSRLGEGSFIDNKKIYIIKKSDLSNSVGSISSKYWNHESSVMQSIKDNFKNINSYGCIGLEYVDIARNIRDFTILSKLSPWDHLPGVLIVKEAGGSILHFDKSDYNHLTEKKNLVVANSFFLQNKIINLINR